MMRVALVSLALSLPTLGAPVAETDAFVADGHRLKSATRGAFTHDDFVKF